MVNEDAALLNRPVTQVTPQHFSAAVYSDIDIIVIAKKTPCLRCDRQPARQHPLAFISQHFSQIVQSCFDGLIFSQRERPEIRLIHAHQQSKPKPAAKPTGKKPPAIQWCNRLGFALQFQIRFLAIKFSAPKSAPRGLIRPR